MYTIEAMTVQHKHVFLENPEATSLLREPKLRHWTHRLIAYHNPPLSQCTKKTRFQLQAKRL